MKVSIQRFSTTWPLIFQWCVGICLGMVIFIDVTILLTCLNFDIDIESTTIFIKLLNYRYIFGILHITNTHAIRIHYYLYTYIHTWDKITDDSHMHTTHVNKPVGMKTHSYMVQTTKIWYFKPQHQIHDQHDT